MFNEEDFDLETERLGTMSPEALTLYLARQGISPEDTRVGLQDLMFEMREIQRREMLEHYEDLSVEQELGLKR